ncbi:snRNA-activating protein complex subunit 3-like [Diadema setosum]|uniref:snRNA-activating protein complex subunit 3-like n=1 Tax=Diadema setosum TaxID=31175 RepID=UPI003B3A8035
MCAAVADESQEQEDKTKGTCSKLIAVADFQESWNILDDANFRFDVRDLPDEDVVKELGVSSVLAEELRKVCSVDTLHSEMTTCVPTAKHVAIVNGKVPDGCEQLESVRRRAENYGQYGQCGIPLRCKWSHYYYDDEPTTAKPLNRPVTLLTVSVTVSRKVQHASHMVKHDCELLVHADQPLTALKDNLICPLDMVYIEGECSEHPDAVSDTRAQDLFKSSYFFIENVFYNDMRDPAARDISAPVQEWLRQGKSDLIKGEVTSARMSEVTFNDLKVRLGYPYLYCHQGDCEHNITFTDIRFLNGDDPQDLEQYPLLLNKSKFYKIACYACKLLISKWMTQEDLLAPHDPCFFCDICFYKFHYDPDGNKLGTFKAYRFIDPSIFR